MRSKCFVSQTRVLLQSLKGKLIHRHFRYHSIRVILQNFIVVGLSVFLFVAFNERFYVRVFPYCNHCSSKPISLSLSLSTFSTCLLMFSLSMFLSMFLQYFYLYFFRLFSVFFKQTSIQILQQINVNKCPSSIQCRDSNSKPSEYAPLTTRPGFPTLSICTYLASSL